MFTSKGDEHDEFVFQGMYNRCLFHYCRDYVERFKVILADANVMNFLFMKNTSGFALSK